MTLYTIDKNCLYRLDVEHCQWGDKLENAISFELNNLPDNKKDVVPDETVDFCRWFNNGQI